MTGRKVLARRAMRAALEIRRLGNEVRGDPICVYDLAERLGIEVKFCPGSSLGGMYAKASRTVLVPTLRPPGRQAFTCAHEIGHWYFGHGSRIDDLAAVEADYERDPDEQLANTFAGYLLMTPWAVQASLDVRGWRAAELTPTQVYLLSSQFGVGYETVVHHFRISLEMIARPVADRLLRSTPKLIRREVLGDDRLRHMVLADRMWRKVAIDLQVGDVAVLEQDVTLTGASITSAGRCHAGNIIEAVMPGIGLVQATDGQWAASVRVRRRDFEGRSIYRHLEDPDVDAAA
jgi:Zn-dependent peptidase ImmA (M78 family)